MKKLLISHNTWSKKKTAVQSSKNKQTLTQMNKSNRPFHKHLSNTLSKKPNNQWKEKPFILRMSPNNNIHIWWNPTLNLMTKRKKKNNFWPKSMSNSSSSERNKQPIARYLTYVLKALIKLKIIALLSIKMKLMKHLAVTISPINQRCFKNTC